MKIQKQSPPCTALSYSSCWAPAETLGIGQWLGHESWLNDSFSAATGTLGDPFIKPRGRRRIGLTSMLCSDIYVRWALRERLTQWPPYAQTQQSQGQSLGSGSAWGGAASSQVTGWVSGGPVAGKLGIKHCVHTLALAPPMFFLELVLLLLVQKKWCIWSLNQGPKTRAPLTFLLQQQSAKDGNASRHL